MTQPGTRGVLPTHSFAFSKPYEDSGAANFG